MFGRNSRILEDRHEQVHIIMERVSGKTMDAFIEWKSAKDSIAGRNKLVNDHRPSQKPMLDDREAILSLAPQEELQKAMFPYGRGLYWMGCTPHIDTTIPDSEPWDKFKGIVTDEEIIMLEKHCIHSDRVRSSFVLLCL